MKVKMNWFLIPCTDMERAVKFYNTIFNIKLDMVEDPSGDEMAMFSDPNDMTGLNGAIGFVKGREPSTDGVSIYFEVGEAMDIVLSKVEEAGGRVYMPRTSVGKYGHIAMITDTEGNRIGLN